MQVQLNTYSNGCWAMLLKQQWQQQLDAIA
jgi:hypothetical protein